MKNSEQITEIINFLKAQNHTFNQYPYSISVNDIQVHVELSIRSRLSRSQRLMKEELERKGWHWWQLRDLTAFKAFYNSINK